MHADLHAPKPASEMLQRPSLDCDSKIAVLTICAEMNFMANRCDDMIEQSKLLLSFVTSDNASSRLCNRNDRDCWVPFCAIVTCLSKGAT